MSSPAASNVRMIPYSCPLIPQPLTKKPCHFLCSMVVLRWIGIRSNERRAGDDTEGSTFSSYRPRVRSEFRQLGLPSPLQIRDGDDDHKRRGSLQGNL